MSAAAPSNVFVYGTLMAEEVVTSLLGRMPPHSAALIKDYRRFAITGRQYPAIIPVEGSTVKGKVMFDLSPEEMKILDLFEDDEYTREVVSALPLEDGSSTGEMPRRLPCEAGVYVWGDRTAKELVGEWSYEEWRKIHLVDYVEMCKGFPAEGEGLELRLQLERERASK